MFNYYYDKLYELVVNWLAADSTPPEEFPLCDFGRISYELKPGDVILIEGRSRVSEIIKLMTQSSWSHAALYIGRLFDIGNPSLRKQVQQHYHGEESEQLLIESQLGLGTVITPLSRYRQDHIRICRPKGVSAGDVQRIIGYTVQHLGKEYDVRQILDLARLLYPWSVLPRRWRSTLFQRSGLSRKEICSTLIAEAFGSVNFPILPMIKVADNHRVEFIKRNPRLYTPSDFDYSPFFEIIKYPIIELTGNPVYHSLPWATNKVSNDDGQIMFSFDTDGEAGTMSAEQKLKDASHKKD